MIHSSVVEVSHHFLFLIPRKSLRFRFLRRRLDSLMKASLTMLNMGVLNPADLFLVLGGLRRRSPAPENAVLCSAEISDVIWYDGHPKKSATQRQIDKNHGTSTAVSIFDPQCVRWPSGWLFSLSDWRRHWIPSSVTRGGDAAGASMSCECSVPCSVSAAEGFDATRAQDEFAGQSYQSPTAADARNNMKK